MKPDRALAAPPRCVFVTGPQGPGKSRWLDARVARVLAEQPGARCAVIVAEEGLARGKRLAGVAGVVAVRRILLPCVCCPGVAELPRTVREIVAEVRPDWIFIEVPALAAQGLVGEYERELGWPREVVVWLSREWARARQAQALSFFQTELFARADLVVQDEAAEPADTANGGPAAISFG